jgi:hypothetical protein
MRARVHSQDAQRLHVLLVSDGLRLELHVEQQAMILLTNLVAQLAVLATKAPEFLRLITTVLGPILDVGPVIRACATCS